MKLADVSEIFGKISPPPAISKFAGDNPTGGQGISTFLSNLISLFYAAATVVLIFMLLVLIEKLT